MKPRLVTICLASLLGILLVGCTTEPMQVYSEARLSPDSEVRVSTDPERAHGAPAPDVDRKVYLVKTDGQSLTDAKAVIRRNPCPTEAHVLPGRHELDIRYMYRNMQTDGRLWFDGEAGREYRVRNQIDGYRFRFWIEDVAAGAVVGGYRQYGLLRQGASVR